MHFNRALRHDVSPPDAPTGSHSVNCQLSRQLGCAEAVLQCRLQLCDCGGGGGCAAVTVSRLDALRQIFERGQHRSRGINLSATLSRQQFWPRSEYLTVALESVHHTHDAATCTALDLLLQCSRLGGGGWNLMPTGVYNGNGGF